MSAARNNALDGVRGCAVMAVLLYHAHYSWARGGFLGVDMFFVLSGYLITKGLLRLQLAHKSRFARAYLHFLQRRAARLAPALLAALACAFVLTSLTGTSADRSRLMRCTGAAGSYAMNLPVAERLHCSAIWHVTWSLASEEQFYLLWPLLLTAVIVAAGRSKKCVPAPVVAVALGLFTVSIAWQVALRAKGASTSRVLFSPDGRSLVLLVGCALAAARLEQVKPGVRRMAGLLGAFALLGDIAFASAGTGYSTLLALLVSAAGTGALVLAVTGGEQNLVSRALGSHVPAAAGRLSYSLYLFHELAFRIGDLLAARGTLGYELIRWPLCLAAAFCSYRLVERPCRTKFNRLMDDRRLRAPDVLATAPRGSSPLTSTPLIAPQRTTKKCVANDVPKPHPLSVTFFGSYAIGMGLAHVDLSACPEQTQAVLPGGTSRSRQCANPKRP
jgi:peptidoglycan/LPS O-acetylase OafA/YrhL